MIWTGHTNSKILILKAHFTNHNKVYKFVLFIFQNIYFGSKSILVKNSEFVVSELVVGSVEQDNQRKNLYASKYQWYDKSSA